MGESPRVVHRFCRTCNARERVIIDGKCVVCGNDPATDPFTAELKWVGDLVQQPTRRVGRMVIVTNTPWTKGEKAVAGLLIFATVYVLIQVARSVMMW